jgi:hypothetical protein
LFPPFWGDSCGNGGAGTCCSVHVRVWFEHCQHCDFGVQVREVFLSLASSESDVVSVALGKLFHLADVAGVEELHRQQGVARLSLLLVGIQESPFKPDVGIVQAACEILWMLMQSAKGMMDLACSVGAASANASCVRDPLSGAAVSSVVAAELGSRSLLALFKSVGGNVEVALPAFRILFQMAKHGELEAVCL